MEQWMTRYERGNDALWSPWLLSSLSSSPTTRTSTITPGHICGHSLLPPGDVSHPVTSGEERESNPAVYPSQRTKHTWSHHDIWEGRDAWDRHPFNFLSHSSTHWEWQLPLILRSSVSLSDGAVYSTKERHPSSLNACVWVSGAQARHLSGATAID